MPLSGGDPLGAGRDGNGAPAAKSTLRSPLSHRATGGCRDEGGVEVVPQPLSNSEAGGAAANPAFTGAHTGTGTGTGTDTGVGVTGRVTDGGGPDAAAEIFRLPRNELGWGLGSWRSEEPLDREERWPVAAANCWLPASPGWGGRAERNKGGRGRQRHQATAVVVMGHPWMTMTLALEREIGRAGQAPGRTGKGRTGRPGPRRATAASPTGPPARRATGRGSWHKRRRLLRTVGEEAMPWAGPRGGRNYSLAGAGAWTGRPSFLGAASVGNLSTCTATSLAGCVRYLSTNPPRLKKGDPSAPSAAVAPLHSAPPQTARPYLTLDSTAPPAASAVATYPAVACCTLHLGARLPVDQLCEPPRARAPSIALHTYIHTTHIHTRPPLSAACSCTQYSNHPWEQLTASQSLCSASSSLSRSALEIPEPC
ncbi:hypothetical protein CC78DRAFT_574806 [Lojkania enalia]|uniref:Uncharacterized protein n=1 Tax=Lojkania enalia TaxID=147567 RepID=A0A9P4NBD1_9PLEO|nr:hypothetical protein CC78DRAFT_574806 [Didymosphaeria enalia]